jgi:hypothetical protein
VTTSVIKDNFPSRCLSAAPWAGIARLECGHLTVDVVIALANLGQIMLPDLAQPSTRKLANPGTSMTPELIIHVHQLFLRPRTTSSAAIRADMRSCCLGGPSCRCGARAGAALGGEGAERRGRDPGCIGIRVGGCTCECRRSGFQLPPLDAPEGTGPVFIGGGAVSCPDCFKSGAMPQEEERRGQGPRLVRSAPHGQTCPGVVSARGCGRGWWVTSAG